jgi:hypothetical protein
MPDEIVVTGGSVTIEFSESAHTPSTPTSAGKLKYTADGLKLASLMVNGTEVQKLDRQDTVTIVCADDDGISAAP